MKNKIISVTLASILFTTMASTNVFASSLINKSAGNPPIQRVTTPITDPSNEIYRVRKSFDNVVANDIVSGVFGGLVTKIPVIGPWIAGPVAIKINHELESHDYVYVETILYEGTGADGNRYASVYVNYYSDSNYTNMIDCQITTRRI